MLPSPTVGEADGDRLHPTPVRTWTAIGALHMPDPTMYPPPAIEEDGTWFCNLAHHHATGEQHQTGEHAWVCTSCWESSRLTRCDACHERFSYTVPTLGGRRRCMNCLPRHQWRHCWSCGHAGRITRPEWREVDGGNHVCASCWESDGYVLCDHPGCGVGVRWSDYCDDHESHDYDEDCSCSSCYDTAHETSTSGLINYYSYKPSPIFFGEGALFMGFELEIGTPFGRLDDAARLVCNHVGDRAYLKDDSSISHGFEIVTHPMTHGYALGQFPWQMLDELRDMGCDVNEDENGMHVHVNREAFANPLHVYRWMKFLHRNADQVQTIARRRDNHWAAWDSNTRRAIKDLAKGGTYIERRPYPDEPDYVVRDYVPRYSAINVHNSHTFEVRAFASTLNRQEAQAALDLVAGSVEYTRNLTAKDIAGGGWDWINFADWASDRPEYAALTGEMEALECAC